MRAQSHNFARFWKFGVHAMADQPLLLDLFCCAGGAARGYANAGFDVIGVDIMQQPRYPFKFILADALAFLDDLVSSGEISEYSALHGSPPCQAFSSLSNCVPGTKAKYPNLIPATRERFASIGLPYVIENVVGAPLNPTVTLCGTSFGKRLRLHRLFETNFAIKQPECNHAGYVLNPYSQAGRDRIKAEYPDQTIGSVWRQEKGVEWMNDHEASEAIMPAYTEYIGKQLLRDLQEV